MIESFSWKRGKTPASSPVVLSVIVAAYPLTVLFVQWLLKARKAPVPIGSIPAVHNLVLCLGSLVMFLGTLQAAYVDSQENQWLWASEGKYTWLVCFPPGTKSIGRIFFWSYVYYLSKFYELLDTFILVLKKKPLSLLHVYHHAVVVVMCYLWLEYQQSLQVIALLTNTGIHVIMYFYYFMHSLGVPPPWKIFVTNSQILQFVFSFIASLPFLYLHFSRPQGCAGMWAWVFNVVFNLTLLYLFIDFHRRNYGKRKGSESRSRRRVKAE